MRIARWILMLGLLAPIAARSAGPSETFDAANRLYEQGKFSDAISAYKQLLQSSNASPAIYFNLGNAFYKSGQIGQALAAYHQARQIAPRDPDVRANIQFIRSHVQGPTLVPGRIQRSLETLTVNEWTTLAAVALWIWLVLLAVAQLRPNLKSTLRGFVLVSGISTLAIAAGLAAVIAIQSSPIVIVKSPNTIARSGPLDEATSVFNLADGAELTVLDVKDAWLQISPGGRRIGWVKREQVVSALDSRHP